jgi:primosomal protein N' (replication factor Y)
VILQTYQPESYVIQAASRHDFPAFYGKELEFRRQHRYPPYARLVRLELRRTNPEAAEAGAQQMAGQLRAWIAEEKRGGTDLIGPVPSFYARLEGQYRWQIVLRGPDPASLLQGRNLGNWQVEVDPPSLL